MNYRLGITLMLLLVSELTLAWQDRRTSLDEAVSEARERYNGRVLSAETMRRNGQETHNVRILTRDGQVRRHRVDADEHPPQRPRGKRDYRR